MHRPRPQPHFLPSFYHQELPRLRALRARAEYRITPAIYQLLPPSNNDDDVPALDRRQRSMRDDMMRSATRAARRAAPFLSSAKPFFDAIISIAAPIARTRQPSRSISLLRD